MAETARFVLIDREMFVEEHEFPQGMDLSLAIKCGAVHLAESVGLNPIHVGNDSRHIVIERSRHLTAKVVCRFDGSAMVRISASGRE
jgi:hypothetical protein